MLVHEVGPVKYFCNIMFLLRLNHRADDSTLLPLEVCVGVVFKGVSFFLLSIPEGIKEINSTEHSCFYMNQAHMYLNKPLLKVDGEQQRP